MRKPTLRLLPLLFSLSSPAQDLAGIGFRAPAAWSNRGVIEAAGEPPRLVLERRDDRGGERAQIVVVATPWQECGLVDVVTAAADAALVGRKTVSRGAVELGTTASGHVFAAEQISARERTRDRVTFRFVAMRVGERLVVACLRNLDLADAERLHADFATFLDTLGTRSPQAAARSFDAEQVRKDELARRKPGIVSGNVYDALGRPFALAGARVKVAVWGTTFAGDRAHYDLEIDENGHFEQEVPRGLYRMHATAYLPFENDVLPCELHELDERPSDQDQNSAAGIVKDYVLRLSGPRAGGPKTHGWHGGWLCLCDGALCKDVFGALARRHPKGSVVRVVLTPKGPLVDGSVGAPITFDGDLEKMSSGAGDSRVSIPFGRYTASAALVTPNGTRIPLLVAEGMSVPEGSGHTCEFAYRPDKNTIGDTVAQVYLAVCDS